MSLPNVRPLSFGEILDGSFTLYRRHFLTLFVTSLIPLVPLAFLWTELMRFAMLNPALQEAAAEQMAGPALQFALVGGAGITLMWAALVRQLSRAYVGKTVSLPDGYRQAFRAFLPLVGVAFIAFLVYLAFIVAAMLVAMVIGLIGAAFQSPAVVVVLAVLLWIAALAMVLVFFSFFFAVVPAVVVERAGPVEAVGRSFRLARGALGRVAGVLAVGWIIMFLPVIGIGFLVGALTGVTDDPATLTSRVLMIHQIVSMASWALSNPFLVGCIVLLYYDRRVRTEAYDLELAADELVMAR